MDDKKVIEYMELAVKVMKNTPQEKRLDGKINPSVGAVLVLPNGKFYTACRGELRNGNHAEYTLLERKLIDVDCTNSTLFVTLEPCVGDARNPPKHPCCEWIVGARIRTVYVAIQDPDPNVAGEGINYLVNHGIKVITFKKRYCDEVTSFNKKFLEQASHRTKKEKDKMKAFSLNDIIENESAIEWLSIDALSEFAKSMEMDFSNNPEDVYDELCEIGLAYKKDNKYSINKNCLILFGKKPSKLLHQVCIKCFAKINENSDDFTYDGPMVLAIDPVINWMTLHILHQVNDNIRRERVPVIPIIAIREGLINSIAHRDYSIEEAKIHIEMYQDRIVIRSPGAPQPPVTIESLKKFEAPSFSRNPKIAYVFRTMKLMEENRLGMNTFADFKEKYHLKSPTYELIPPDLVLTFYYEKLKPIDPSRILNKEELKGYNFIKNKGEVSKSEYATEFSLSLKTAQRHIAKMREQGLVETNGMADTSKLLRYKVKKIL